MNSKKNESKGCLTVILGTIAIIASVAVYAVLTSLLNNLLVSLRFKESAQCALLPLSMAGVFVAFIIFDVLFVLWQFKLAKKGAEGDAKFSRIFKIVLIVCLAVLLIFPIVSANTFTRLDEDSISQVFFAEYRTYSLNSDITRSTLACTEDGSLTFTLTMKDGEKFELFRSVSSCGDGFINEYENLYGYASHVTSILSSSGNPPRIIGEEYMETAYKDAHPEIWKYLEKMIDTSK